MGLFKAFESWTFSDFASFIGGLFIIGSIIFEAFKKATERTEWAKKRKEKRNAEKREAAKKQYREFTDEFVKEFVPPLVKPFAEADEKIMKSLSNLTNSSNDMLRKEMTDIYYKYLPYKKILQYDKKCFVKLYHDYGAQGGNTYIDTLWEEIQTWDTVLTEEELC